MKYVFAIVAFVALLANSYYVGSFVDGEELQVFTPMLIAVCITTAIFSINFSFYQYQASPYKEITRQLSPTHVRLSLLAFTLSLLPLMALSVSPANATILALSVIPTLGVFGFLLLWVARHEVDIVTVIKRKTNERQVHKYLQAYSGQVEKKLAEIEGVKLSDIGDTPMHEWEWTIPPPQPFNSPIMLIESANSLIVKNRDIGAFSMIFEKALDLVNIIYKYQLPKKDGAYKVSGVLNGEARSFIKRMCIDAIDSDVSGALSREIANQISNRLVKLSLTYHQTNDYSFLLLSLLTMVCERCLEREHTEIGIHAVSLSRKIVSKGLERQKGNSQNDIEFSQYEHLLPELTHPIMQVGQQAIKNGNSEILYRCLDAYGWLGCSSIKRKKYQVTVRCLRSLAQLGREARSKNLECFWSRCTIPPWGHAEERLGWIYSWITKIEASEREHWLSAVTQAYQRLLGYQVELVVDESGEKPNLKIIRKNEVYTASYYDHGYERTIDYSDFTFLKDMEMY